MFSAGPPIVQSPSSEPSDLNVTLFVVIMVTIIELVGSFRPEGKTITISKESPNTLEAREEYLGHTAEGQKAPCHETAHEMLCEETTHF